MTEIEEIQLNKIVSLLENAGYDPIAQLQGYIEEGDDSYITRQGNARDMINKIKRESVIEYYRALEGKDK
ncbi:MAG: IreB family regulatory phosphoprotein [Clostridia bacterium]|nr:IreB family regulatory phosphoprotein [Clostridia bacterium]